MQKIAFWVTKERFGIFRVESPLGTERKYTIDTRTKEIKPLQRQASSTIQDSDAMDRILSRVVCLVEAQGILEGETRMVLLSGRGYKKEVVNEKFALKRSLAQPSAHVP